MLAQKRAIKFVEIFIFLTFYLKTEEEYFSSSSQVVVFCLLRNSICPYLPMVMPNELLGEQPKLVDGEHCINLNWDFFSLPVEKMKYLRSFNIVARLSVHKATSAWWERCVDCHVGISLNQLTLPDSRLGFN